MVVFNPPLLLWVFARCAPARNSECTLVISSVLTPFADGCPLPHPCCFVELLSAGLRGLRGFRGLAPKLVVCSHYGSRASRSSFRVAPSARLNFSIIYSSSFLNFLRFADEFGFVRSSLRTRLWIFVIRVR